MTPYCNCSGLPQQQYYPESQYYGPPTGDAIGHGAFGGELVCIESFHEE